MTTKYGGLKKESFCALTESMTPLIAEFFKPKAGKLEVGQFSMSLPFRKEFIGNPLIPCQHGGVVATMTDHVGGFCAWSALDSSTKRVSTIDLRVDYLLPAPVEELHFDAIVISKTKKLIRVDVTCWNSVRDKKIAIGRCLFNVYDGKLDLQHAIDEHLKSAAVRDSKTESV